jgi:hypothetical protein
MSNGRTLLWKGESETVEIVIEGEALVGRDVDVSAVRFRDIAVERPLADCLVGDGVVLALSVGGGTFAACLGCCFGFAIEAHEGPEGPFLVGDVFSRCMTYASEPTIATIRVAKTTQVTSETYQLQKDEPQVEGRVLEEEDCTSGFQSYLRWADGKT